MSSLKSNPQFINLLASIILSGAVFVAYANCYQNSFLYDDLVLVVHNQFIRSWHYFLTFFTTFLGAGNNNASAYYRPLQQILYLLVFQSAGLSTATFHFLNVALHAANAVLMFTLGRKLGFHAGAVFVAALLWALHPIHTEAVTYISATADPLYAFFCLWGALVLLPDFSPRRMGLAAVLFILALMSKESAIAFPLLAAALLYYTNEKRSEDRIYVRLWPLAVIGVLYVILHFALAMHQPKMAVSGAAPQASFLSALKALAVIPRYFQLLLWPSPLYMKHLVDAAAPGAQAELILGILIVALCALQLLRRQTPATLPLSWGILWFAGAFLPVSGVGDIVYEHWMYLPTVGLFLGVAQTIAVALRKNPKVFQSRLLYAVPCVIACLLGYLTWRQNYIWRDEETFYGNIIKQGHPAPEAHINLGVYYTGLGDYKTALTQFEAAETDYAHSTDNFTADNRAALENNIAESLLNLPDGATHREEALQHLRKSIEIDPNYYVALDSLAKLYMQLGNKDLADFYANKARGVQQQFKSIK